MRNMFKNCDLLISLDLSNFNTSQTENIEGMFSGDINLVYINFENFEDTNIKIMDNIFKGTLENMVLCFNESSANKLNKILQNKGCSVIDCSKDWKKNRKLIIAKSNECVSLCPEEALFLYDYQCYQKCPNDFYPYDYECFVSLNFTSNNNCTIKNYFLGLCKLNLSTPIEKKTFIDNVVDGFINIPKFIQF